MSDLWRRVRKPLLSVFIAWHLFALIPWAIPGDAVWFLGLRNAAEPYMLWSGLWQKWDMFSPDPLKLNAWIEAEVVFSGGDSKRYSLPRMEQLSMWQRFLQERFRKWASERVRLDENSLIWPDTARYVARQHWLESTRPPHEVQLIRHFSTIPPPSAQFLRVGEESAQKEIEYRFFRYTVRADDAP